MDDEKTVPQKRQVARIVSIKDLVEGSYVVESGWEPNYIKLATGEKVSRVNIFGTVVNKELDNEANFAQMQLDDGTGLIDVRSFDKGILFDNISVGETLVLIGRPRSYGNQKYIFPEIIKTIKDSSWFELRKLQLALINAKRPPMQDEEKKDEAIVEEIKEEGIEETDSDKVYSLIKQLDNGEGALFEEVMEKSKIKNTDAIIDTMLKSGDIYEVTGRLRVL
ncbi:hypothetical protein JXA85_03735 [Candidatus Woesearchaeota archaeon]|nr:hypothetical protein [Candidatus Woesearchaeota archaeon]